MIIKHGDNVPVNPILIHGIDDDVTENKIQELKDLISQSGDAVPSDVTKSSEDKAQ